MSETTQTDHDKLTALTLDPFQQCVQECVAYRVAFGHVAYFRDLCARVVATDGPSDWTLATAQKTAIMFYALREREKQWKTTNKS